MFKKTLLLLMICMACATNNDFDSAAVRLRESIVANDERQFAKDLAVLGERRYLIEKIEYGKMAVLAAKQGAICNQTILQKLFKAGAVVEQQEVNSKSISSLALCPGFIEQVFPPMTQREQGRVALLSHKLYLESMNIFLRSARDMMAAAKAKKSMDADQLTRLDSLSYFMMNRCIDLCENDDRKQLCEVGKEIYNGRLTVNHAIKKVDKLLEEARTRARTGLERRSGVN